MKKVFILIFIVVLVNKYSFSQTGVADTVTYLKGISANKHLFAGRPFSVLLDSLKLDIKYFSPFAGIPYDKNKETSTTFSFYFPDGADEIYLTYPCLRIDWRPCLDATQSRSLFANYDGKWNNTVKAHYSNAVIEDIRVAE